MNKTTIGILVVALIGSLGLGVYNLVNAPTQEPVVISSGSGQDHYVAETFYAGFGGETYATSTGLGTAATLTVGQLEKYSHFEITPQTSAFTWTFPATSTLGALLKSPGSSKTWIFQNATTTTTNAGTLILAAGTGFNFASASSTDDALTIAGAAVTARQAFYVNCWRQLNTDVFCDVARKFAAD